MTSHTKSWRALAASTPGLGHLREGIPCQDAAAAGTEPRPWLLVCDGRGSAPHSDLGAQAAAQTFARNLVTLDGLLKSALDANEENTQLESLAPQKAWRLVVHAVWDALGQCQSELAQQHGGSAEDYEFTLAVAIVGTYRTGFIQVGDSSIVVEKSGSCGLLYFPDNSEDGQATWFVTPGPIPPKHLHTGLIKTANITGIAAFSDGVATCTLAMPEGRPSECFSQLFADARGNQLSTKALHHYLTRDFWQEHTLDDRSLALLVPSSFAAITPATVPAIKPVRTVQELSHPAPSHAAHPVQPIVTAPDKKLLQIIFWQNVGLLILACATVTLAILLLQRQSRDARLQQNSLIQAVDKTVETNPTLEDGTTPNQPEN